MKKPVAAFLVVLMLLCMFPLTSLADANIVIYSNDNNYNLAAHGIKNGDIIVIQPNLSVTLVGDPDTTYTNFEIYCNSGVDLTLQDVNINDRNYPGFCPLTIENGAGNKLRVSGSNLLQGGSTDPAVFVKSGAALTIYGDGYGGGTLDAIGSAGSAGIGGAGHGGCGSITIVSGTVGATSLLNGAGIGSGLSGTGGSVTISGGTVTASGGPVGVGLGGGGAGIGGGSLSEPVSVSISGGTVRADGYDGGAGIGSGANCSSGSIAITGGSVIASGSNGSSGGAGIGSTSNAGPITISGGSVYAVGGLQKPGIGGMINCADIDISGGTVAASGGTNATYDIGSISSPSAEFSISGTSVVFLRNNSCMTPVTTTHMNTTITQVVNGTAFGITTPTGWTPTFGAYLRKYTVSYDANGGSGTVPSPVTQHTGSMVTTDSGSSLSRAGYGLTGWNTAANGSGTAYALGASFLISSDMVLYAQWSYNCFNIFTDGNYTLNSSYYTGAGDTLIIAGGHDVTLTSNGSTLSNYKILCSPKTHLTLNNVVINNHANDDICPLKFNDSGNTLTLTGTNTLSGGAHEPAICVEDIAELTVNGSGTLTAQGGSSGAGIGGGSNSSGGDITISNGSITATGGGGAAGIGGGSGGSGGTITISGGTVTATGATQGAGIGGGSGGSGGDITISGGTIQATSIALGAGIGGGLNGSGGSITISGGTSTTTGGQYAAGIGGGNGGSGGDVSITNGVVLATKGADAPYDIGDGDSGSGGTLSLSGFAAVFLKNDDCVAATTTTHTHMNLTRATSGTVYGGIEVPWTGSFGEYIPAGTYVLDSTFNNNILTIDAGPGMTLQGDGSTLTNFQISCGAGAPLTLKNVSIDDNATDGTCPLTFTGSGNTLTLSGTSTLTAGLNKPAVSVEGTTQLEINGSGTINATGGMDGAGIGSGDGVNCGTITISGGTVNATGGAPEAAFGGSAGIGGGRSGSGGSISISAGTVTANGGDYGAGIGGGAFGSGGSISISGGKVTANGGDYGAGIGGGTNAGGGTIEISGGHVFAAEGSGAPCDIGYGASGSGGSLSISDTAAVFLRYSTCIKPTTTHSLQNITGATGGSIYGVPCSWVGSFATYMRLVTVDYSANGGTGSLPGPVTQHIGTTIVAATTGLTRSGCTFAGWNTAANGSGTGYLPGDTVTISANTTLFAQWTHSITASAGTGGSISPSGTVSVSDGSDQTFTITADSGYAIVSVLVDSVEQGDISTYTFSNVTANHTISATFSTAHTITASAGTGGSISPSGTVSVVDGSDQTFTITADSGYEIVSVLMDSVDQGPISTYTFSNVTADHTISASFTAIYTIAAAPNSPAYGSVTGTGSFSTASSVTLTAVPKAGYHFVRWTEGGSGVSTSAAYTFIVTGDRTLVAEFAANTYTVAYNANGGAGTTASGSHTYGVAKVLTQNGFTRTGYTFAGWATSAGGSVVYSDKQSVTNLTSTNGATVTLYAKWRANTYTVAYKANGGTGSTASSSHTYGVAKVLTQNGFTRTGYTFAGWATSAGGSVVYSDKQSVTNLTSTNGATVTLYAKWRANTYTVAYKANGGTGSTASSSHTYGVAKVLTQNGFTRTGYTFAGWATSAGGSVVYSDKQSVTNLTSTNGATVTLYAKWQTDNGTPSLAAESVGTTSVKLTWGKVTGANGYEVYRAASSDGTYSKIYSATSGSTVSYTNTGLTIGKTYYYKVRAYCTTGATTTYGSFSSVCKVTMPTYKDQIISGKLKRTYYNSDGSVNRVQEYYGANTSSGVKKISYYTKGVRMIYKLYNTSGKLTTLVELYSSGKTKKVSYYSASTGKRTSYKLYDTAGHMTHYAVCFADGKNAKKMNYYNAATGIRSGYKTYRTDGSCSCYVKCDSKGNPSVATYYDSKGKVTKTVNY